MAAVNLLSVKRAAGIYVAVAQKAVKGTRDFKIHVPWMLYSEKMLKSRGLAYIAN